MSTTATTIDTEYQMQRPLPPVNPDADVERRERLGGPLSCYYREAARGSG